MTISTRGPYHSRTDMTRDGRRGDSDTTRTTTTTTEQQQQQPSSSNNINNNRTTTTTTEQQQQQQQQHYLDKLSTPLTQQTLLTDAEPNRD